MSYIHKVDKDIKEYFNLLEPEYPSFLNDYIETKRLQKQKYISVSCGTIYSKMYSSHKFYSSLDHSVAVALIIWHFTHDKKQTLSGLFHDIATPVFKHSIDFLNGDYMMQESTEELTTYFIKSDKDIMNLLKRDGIKLSDVNNYHIYPIADNDTPHLSSDRLEYSLSNALFQYKILKLKDIKRMYDDVEVEHDEKENLELGFKTKEIAEDFVNLTSKMSVLYRDDKTRFSMQFLADIIKQLNSDGVIEKKDLYEKKESEIIDIIENSKYGVLFDKWKNAKKVNVSGKEREGVYYVNHGAKIRYINPLASGKRIYDISIKAKENIDKNLSYNMDNYVYLDFSFDDINKK